MLNKIRILLMFFQSQVSSLSPQKVYSPISFLQVAATAWWNVPVSPATWKLSFFQRFFFRCAHAAQEIFSLSWNSHPQMKIFSRLRRGSGVLTLKVSKILVWGHWIFSTKTCVWILNCSKDPGLWTLNFSNKPWCVKIKKFRNIPPCVDIEIFKKIPQCED